MIENYKIDTYSSFKNQELYKSFVITNHYSKSLSRGNRIIFVLKINNELSGISVFSYPTGKGSILECKRFVLWKNAKKNLASWFMSKCLKEIKKQKLCDAILSYADPNFGHTGIMYKASNFKYLGTQKTKGQAIKINGIKKLIHLRIVYQKINNKYTKTAIKMQNLLKLKKAKYVSLPKKHIFLYEFYK